MSKLYLDHAAEKEANDIGRKFMNSTDVVGDMSRAYGTDLSTVKLHTDESAAAQAADRGVDAFSTGKDVFFARGAFDQSDPASRGLLAHELSHSLQQGVGGEMGGMAQSAPMGAAQGGLLTSFRKKFGLQLSDRERKKLRMPYMEEYRPVSERMWRDESINSAETALGEDTSSQIYEMLNNADARFQTLKQSGDKEALFKHMDTLGMVLGSHHSPLESLVGDNPELMQHAGSILSYGITNIMSDGLFDSPEYKKHINTRQQQGYEYAKPKWDEYFSQVKAAQKAGVEHDRSTHTALLRDEQFSDYVKANLAQTGVELAGSSFFGRGSLYDPQYYTPEDDFLDDFRYVFNFDQDRYYEGAGQQLMKDYLAADFQQAAAPVENPQLPKHILNTQRRRVGTQGKARRKHHFRRWLNK